MKNSKRNIVAIVALAALLSACSGDDGAIGPQGPQGETGAQGPQGDTGSQGDQGPTGSFGAYTIEVTNITHGQPMAPSAIILHEPGFNGFVAGEAASLGIETLAEGGSPDMLISEAQDATQFLDATTTAGINPPGETTALTTFLVPELDIDNVRITVASMLVDTNDAFIGVDAHDISNMTVGQQMTVFALIWDAGTEANLETSSTMPGPAATEAGGGGAGAGFDAARDDLIDAVRIHAGVVTSANASDASREGLSTSVLDQSDRFDSVGAKVVITRTR
ncbi:MAG: spondin domain-containing protein [Glaciecola sp.]